MNAQPSPQANATACGCRTFRSHRSGRLISLVRPSQAPSPLERDGHRETFLSARRLPRMAQLCRQTLHLCPETPRWNTRSQVKPLHAHGWHEGCFVACMARSLLLAGTPLLLLAALASCSGSTTPSAETSDAAPESSAPDGPGSDNHSDAGDVCADGLTLEEYCTVCSSEELIHQYNASTTCGAAHPCASTDNLSSMLAQPPSCDGTTGLQISAGCGYVVFRCGHWGYSWWKAYDAKTGKLVGLQEGNDTDGGHLCGSLGYGNSSVAGTVPPSSCLCPCAGSECLAAAAGTGCDAGPDAQPDAPPVHPKPGSYSLVLNSTSTCGTPHSSTARIDLRDFDNSLQAVVAFSYQPPAAMQSTVSGSSLVLTGDAKGFSTEGEANETQRWTSLVIDLAPGGIPTTAHGSGTFHQFDGGDSFCADTKLVGEGIVEPDSTSPEVGVSFLRRRGPTHPLPWDVFRLLSSEPASWGLPQATITKAGATTPMMFTAMQGDLLVDWAGTTEQRASFNWDVLRGSSLHIAVGPVTDPSANSSTSVSTDFDVLDPGAVVASQDFGSAAGYAAFGGATYVAGGDPCESGGCVDFGMLNPECPVPTLGLALRVGAASATNVKIRYRVVGDSYQPLTVSLTPADMKLTPSTQLTPVTQSNGSWSDLAVPIPAGWPVTDVGVLIVPGSGSPDPDCIFGFSTPVRIIIDRVWVE